MSAAAARAPTLPKAGTKVIFSDLDGTLVHFEKYFTPRGKLVAGDGGDDATTTALYRNEQEGSPLLGQTRVCELMPTLTMGPGAFSRRSAELIAKLRKECGVKFVYVSGARKSTMLKRLPLLAPADYAVAETGGRMYKLVDDGEGGQTPVLDDEWTTKIEASCGPIRGDEDVPLEDRKGALWDWCRALTSRGVPCDIRDYTCCFRVDCKKKPGSEDIVKAALGEMPAGVTCAQNLGKYDFFPSHSGKGNAVTFLLSKLGMSKDDAVALFDDENDLPMAAACGHACVMGCTHESIEEHIPRNPHWHVATEAGVFATEEMLEMLLEHATSARASS